MKQKNNGKLSSDLLKKIIFNNIERKRKEVLTTPVIGQDCGIIRSDDLICVSTDPITATTENIGKLAVIINLNDIAAAMAEPFGVTVTILMPSHSSVEELEKISAQVLDECLNNNVQVIGGHTEFTDSVNKPIVSITAFGKINMHKYLNRSNPKLSSYIYVTKNLGLEGSYIIAKEKQEELKEILTDSEIQEAHSYIKLLSVTKDANLVKEKDICLMHDITEGGLIGALSELSENLKLSYELYDKQMPLTQVTKKICEHFKINPLKLISSGSMLIISNEKLPCEIDGIKYTLIGQLTQRKSEKILQNQNIVTDEIYRVL